MAQPVVRVLKPFASLKVESRTNLAQADSERRSYVQAFYQPQKPATMWRGFDPLATVNKEA